MLLLQGQLAAQLPVLPPLLAPNGWLYAGSVVALADTAFGYGWAMAASSTWSSARTTSPPSR